MGRSIFARQSAALAVVRDTQRQPVSVQFEVADVVLTDLTRAERAFEMVNHDTVLGFKGVGSVVGSVGVECGGFLMVGRVGAAVWKTGAISTDDVYGHMAHAVIRNHSDRLARDELIRSLDRDQLP